MNVIEEQEKEIDTRDHDETEELYIQDNILNHLASMYLQVLGG